MIYAILYLIGFAAAFALVSIEDAPPSGANSFWLALFWPVIFSAIVGLAALEYSQYYLDILARRIHSWGMWKGRQ